MTSITRSRDVPTHDNRSDDKSCFPAHPLSMSSACQTFYQIDATSGTVAVFSLGKARNEDLLFGHIRRLQAFNLTPGILGRALFRFLFVRAPGGGKRIITDCHRDLEALGMIGALFIQ